MKGRTPKPTALRELQGNPGKRADDGRAEVAMPAGTPEPPAHLSPGARQEWFRTVAWLMQVHGLLSPTDHAAIGIYCSYYDQWQQAEQTLPELRARQLRLDTEIDTLTTDLFTAKKKPAAALQLRRDLLTSERGRVLAAINAATGERNKARKEMRAYLAELGLTPAARSRIRVDTGQLPLPGLADHKPSPFEQAQRDAAS